MPYTQQTWVDDDPTTPLSGARMTHLEQGVGTAQTTAESAASAAATAQAAATPETIQDLVNAMVVAGTNITKTYDDTAGTLTLASTAAGGGTTDPNAVHTTGNSTVSGVITFSASPIVPTPTTATQAATKAYADSVASGFNTALASYSHDPIPIPVQAFVALSATQVSSQTIAGVFKSPITFDKGTAGAAVGIAEAAGVALPPDWNTFSIRANYALFGAPADSSTNTARMGVGIIQHDDSGTVLAAPTYTYTNMTLTVGAAQGTTVSMTSTAYTRTNAKAIVHLTRDAQAAVTAGDTYGSRMMLVSADLVWVS